MEEIEAGVRDQLLAKFDEKAETKEDKAADSKKSAKDAVANELPPLES